ncbi:MAG: sulfite exporter TauE/SafE family protein [Rickettsiales bacterium]|nr:sulfite exporter TauE/SafE family protein [Rickettsiales bacterium]
MHDLTIILSLFSLGFFGGFSHCIGMCSPFVFTQVTNRLTKTKVENFSRLKNFALIPYHFGRITTYSLIGICCSFLTKNIRDFTEFRIIATFFLLIAAMAFLELLFEKSFFKSIKNKLPIKSKSLKINSNGPKFLSSLLSNLFKNPEKFNGFFLGVILGFIPCGLLYSAFLLAMTISSPFIAGIGMFAFGIATFPALFFTASGGYFFLKKFKQELKIISKIILTINFVTIFLMAISLIR